ncbi:MAG: SDR family NAD(P)-dependent oxidoreductase [Martelella sp.]|uniref:SDR family NAD(P)-dependent oxidoreductase n=1 Tax=Martelella sp. TaxID=1969699 RepID=UPI003242DE03
MTRFSVEGRKAIVKGGTRGLGHGIAEALLEEGAEVVIFGSDARAEEVAVGFRQRGFACQGLAVGLADTTARGAGFDRAVALIGGRLDILVTAAGVQRRHRSEEFPLDDWQAVLEVNLTAVFDLCQRAAKVMLPQGGGKIVNIASLLSFFGGFTVPAYAASKGGIAQLTKALANEWAGLGFEHFACRTEDEMIARCKGANVILNQYGPFTDKVLSALSPELGLIVRYGVGVVNVDLDAAGRHGVQVCNVPDYGMNEVSDHALALMLALIRKIPMITANTRKGAWDYRQTIPVRRIQEMTIGVLGVGRIGGLFARKAEALGGRVVLCDPYKPDLRKEFPDEQVTFDEFLQIADVISIHCPRSPETCRLLGAPEFACMKKGALVINTARGGIIDEAALAAPLVSGHLGGAGIDTAEHEPLPATSPLLAAPNCLVTPHMAWYSEAAARELKRKVAEETVRFARNEKLHYPVNSIGRSAA